MAGVGTRKVNEDAFRSVLGEEKIKINTRTRNKSPDALNVIFPEEFGQQ